MTAQNQQLPTIDGLARSIASDNFKAKLVETLPKHINVDAFVRNTINAIQTHPQQDKLLNSDRKTLFTSCQKAASDGLMLDGREATLVAYYNKEKRTNDISYIPMTQGLVKSAKNSGEVVDIFAEVVHEQDFFRYRPNIDLVPEWEPDWKIAPSQRGTPVLAYAVVKLKDESTIVRVLHAERVMQIAAQGNNSWQYDPDKGKNWSEWWRKTVIRNVLKYAPKSSDLIHLMDTGDKNEFPDMNNRNKDADRLSDVNNVFTANGIKTNESVDKSTGEIIDQVQQEAEPEKTAQETQPEQVQEKSLEDEAEDLF